MIVFNVPQATLQQPRIVAGDISFVDYRDKGGPFRNCVWFDQYAISFVQNGQKMIYRAGGNTVLRPGYGMLIPEGKSIIAEHSDTDAHYQSFIVFFPGQLGRDFIAGLTAAKQAKTDAPYIHFRVNTYLNEYIRQMRSLINGGQQISTAMALLKVTELLAALHELHPQLLVTMFGPKGNLSLKTVVENNILNELTIDELAFLTNRSVSSFKRDFEKAYGIPPQRYIRDRRLEMASTELAQGRSAADLYLRYGYQHLSNFNTAFKRKFGKTPADYRLHANLNLLQGEMNFSQ